MAVRSVMKRPVVGIFGWTNCLRRLQWPIIHRLLDVSDGQVVLDLGTGQMQYAIVFARYDGAYVIAVDLDFRMDRVGEAMGKGVVPLRANGQALPLADRSIDCILMSSLLHMVPEPLQLLTECRRVLKPGGHVVLSVPNHYQFIPVLMRSFAGPLLCQLFGLPRTPEELVRHLNERFHVGGRQGYYSLEELAGLLSTSGFRVVEHEYAPGRFGSLMWELSVLGYVSFGNLAFHLLFLAYPLARLCDILTKSSSGSEHIVKVSPVYEH